MAIVELVDRDTDAKGQTGPVLVNDEAELRLLGSDLLLLHLARGGLG